MRSAKRKKGTEGSHLNAAIWPHHVNIEILTNKAEKLFVSCKISKTVTVRNTKFGKCMSDVLT